MAEAEVEHHPWDRQPGESGLWYHRFTVYRQLGPGRSLLKSVNQWLRAKGKNEARQPHGSWTAAAEQWQWRVRSEAFDAWELAEGERRHKAETDRLFDHMQQALRAAYGKLTARLQSVDPDEIPAAVLIPQVIQLIKKLEEMHGRQAASKVEVSGPGGAPIRVDVEERQKVLRELDELERSLGITWVKLPDVEPHGEDADSD